MRTGKIKTGIASFGMSGKVFHAPFINVHPQFELTAIVERSKDLAKAIYPNVRIVRSIDELLAIDELELVIINTPDLTHYEYVKKALEAGKNVVVEKPFVMTTAEGKELIALARERGVMLGVYQNRRWDADYLTVKEILATNKLGRLVEYEATYARYRKQIREGTWKEREGGLVYNLGSHIIDQCVDLFGLPEAVFADVAVMRDEGVVDDYFLIHPLRCSKAPDVRITLKASYLMREQEPRFVLHGVDGSYVKYGVDIQEELLQQGAAPVGDDWGVEEPDKWGVINTEIDGEEVREKYPSQRGDYSGFFDSVYQRLRYGVPLPSDAIRVLPVITIIEAAIESSKTGKVVELSTLWKNYEF
ncbi:MAG: Gfo/Idh/MocA family oxidoreductase [Tannerella sp.]|jgi:predicted dehydrogenase|nr:Gfo/Idh/MocA family oxidoreductase [Tannerella sp.]